MPRAPRKHLLIIKVKGKSTVHEGYIMRLRYGVIAADLEEAKQIINDTYDLSGMEPKSAYWTQDGLPRFCLQLSGKLELPFKDDDGEE